MIKETFVAMRDLPRLREIVAILIRHGLGEFIQRIKLSGTWHKKIAAEEPMANPYLTTAQRFRLAFEDLGPTFIKLGQVLSTRVDIFGPEWIEEFEHLQNNVRPIDSADIKALIQAQSSVPIDSIFRHIDLTPIGSASIAQVHRAVLHNGDEVVIKLKRPDIEAKVQADLRILTHIATLIESEMPEMRRYQPRDMVQYFARSLAKETDLSIELRYLQRFRHAFEQQHNIHIPQVYPAYSNRSLLIQEYIGDTLLKNIGQLQLSESRAHELAQNIAEAVLSMILQHGFFHADPHPGNIFVNTEGRITFIDFGLVGHLSATRRREIITLINALIERDQFAIQYVLSHWAQGNLPDEDLLGVDVLEMMLNYEHTAMRDLHISAIIHDITGIMRTHNLTLPPDLVMLFKTLITLEAVVTNLDGSFQLLEHTKPLVLSVLRQRISPKHVLKKSKMHSQTLLQALDELPQNVMRLSRRMRSGQFNLNLDIQRLEQFGQQIDRSSNRLTMGIVTASLIIGSSIVLSINAGPKIFGLSFFGFIGYLLAFFNSVWILWSIWRSGKH